MGEARPPGTAYIPLPAKSCPRPYPDKALGLRPLRAPGQRVLTFRSQTNSALAESGFRRLLRLRERSTGGVTCCQAVGYWSAGGDCPPGWHRRRPGDPWSSFVWLTAAESPSSKGPTLPSLRPRPCCRFVHLPTSHFLPDSRRSISIALWSVRVTWDALVSVCGYTHLPSSHSAHWPPPPR